MTMKHELVNLQYAGFKIQSGIYIPHFCHVIFSDENDQLYYEYNFFPGRLVECRIQYLEEYFYLLNQEEKETLNSRYTIADNIKAVYVGADKYTGAYHQHPLEARHFVCGSDAEIGKQLQDQHWERITRCWRDAEQFLDILPDNLRRLQILYTIQESFAQHDTKRYFEYGRKINEYMLK